MAHKLIAAAFGIAALFASGAANAATVQITANGNGGANGDTPATVNFAVIYQPFIGGQGNPECGALGSCIQEIDINLRSGLTGGDTNATASNAVFTGLLPNLTSSQTHFNLGTPGLLKITFDPTGFDPGNELTFTATIALLGTHNGGEDFAGRFVTANLLLENGERAAGVFNLQDVHTSIVLLETPLPAALPLFASGLSALGLLGWRRKRRAQTAA